MFFKTIVIFNVFVWVHYSAAIEPNEQKTITFSKKVTDAIVVAAYKCVEDYHKVPCFFKFIADGKCSNSNEFKRDIFCLFVESGYADKKTGLPYEKRIDAVFPKECNELETVKKCNKFSESNPEDTFIKFFGCRQNQSRCLVNLLPPDVHFTSSEQ